jgi:hypothetical protein
MVLLFGVVMLGLLGLLGATVAVGPSLALSYLFAIAYARQRVVSVISRLLVQLGVFCLLFAAATVLSAGVLLSNLEGNAGGPILLFGRDIGDVFEVALRGGAGLSAAAILVGEVAVYRLRRRDRASP